MKPKTLILMVVAIGCGLVAMLGIQQAMQGGQAQVSPRIRVLVATIDIQPGVELTEENVQFLDMPSDSVPEDAVTSIEQYEERAPKFAVMAEDIIRQSRLGKKGEFTQSTQITAGMRVISISVNDTHTLSGLLRPGDRVDLLVTFRGRSDRGVMTTKTKTLLEYVEVFATDDRTISDGARNQETKAKIVSLLVTPEQVNYIKLAESKGELALSWRHPDDDETVAIADIDGALLEELRGTVPMHGADSRAPLYDLDSAEGVGETAVEPDSEGNVRDILEEQEGDEQPVVAEAPEIPVEPQTWSVEIFAGNDASRAEFELPEEPEPVDLEQVEDADTQASTTDAFRWLHRKLSEGQDSTTTEL